MLGILEEEPGVEPEYAEIVDALSMCVPAQLTGEVRLLVAARVGGVRLIDNVGALVGVDVDGGRYAMSSKEISA
jgi:pantoate--beta-alanine ligase